MSKARGTYFTVRDGRKIILGRNLIPLQGLQHILTSAIKNTGLANQYFLALYSGAVTPASSWTAANFATNATEITSTTEGYSQVARPAWVHGALSGAKYDNAASLAQFSIVSTAPITIAGAALLTSSARGGTSGVLVSAIRFPQAQTLGNGATFELGYELELTDGD